MAALAVCCFKWKTAQGYRSQFTARSVNVLARGVARHYRRPHEFVCITDDPAGLDDAIRVVPLWGDHASIASPLQRGPSCYRRLKLFSEEARELIGPRFVMLDLDCVVTADLSPIFDREEDFVINAGTAAGTPYNGSLILMTAGSRRRVWDEFDPVASPRAARALAYIGSDQAWIAACLGPCERTFGRLEGVYAFQSHLWNQTRELPADARLVTFQGHFTPWAPSVYGRYSWIRENFR